MIVLIVEPANPSLCGMLTRWLFELKAGVFVGSIPAGVRERVWDKVTSHKSVESAFLVYNYPTSTGYKIESHGVNKRAEIVDFDGIQMVMRRKVAIIEPIE